ncbi:MAG: excinuclease ABC subunit UvrC [Chloroflexi bacterium]|nr:excinuclease ABC subunit UvrC [Chloroflexota bacterium]MCY3587915.1 excinuclease ABC subunit UvrC [Chloroflexota bacterium]MCY3686004.1 excinuclease ABC subunit UvrC [Chloroflexota bacterium]MDE2707304.1 excinuclease ABC subunit UvrC [Chloroflexota bacterium]
MTTDAAPPTPEQTRAQLQAQVAALPAKPGVYTFRDANDRVIYIGKAANLRSRVRSYFGSPRSLEGKTRVLAERIAQLEVVTTHTEQDALHLEATLVKRHQPFFNVRLKDDKHYPYLKIDVDSPWPRVTIARRVAKDGSRYFGPYASAKSVRTTLDLVKKLFPWRSCDKEITGSDPRPCLEYYIRRCIAPCTSFCTPDEYKEVIDQTMLFLDGKSEAVLKQLKSGMTDAAEELNFERAAQLRDQITAVERVTETQLTADTSAAEIDVFGLAVDGDEAVVQVLFIRGQNMAGSDHFNVAGVKDESAGSVISSFLRQHYESGLQPPRLVLIPDDIDDLALLQNWLSDKRGSKVEVRHPKRGDKRRLVNMATENASETLQMSRVRWMADRGRTDAALEELEEALSLPAPPRRIECYDVSNTQGSNVVASMVVFLDGRPATSEYRRFRIKTVDTSEGPDDFASMAEVIQRRFKRLGEERRAERAQGFNVPDEPSPTQTDEEDQSESEGWGAIPDLVIVDGGRGQVSAAHDVMRNLAVDDIPLAGLAKREELLFQVDSSDPVRLDRRSQGLYLVQRIRDEAHRFAISYHRRLRARQTSQSTLDRIKGIGPRRKKALLRKFGSLQAIREADVTDIAATPGMTQRLAEQLKLEL